MKSVLADFRRSKSALTIFEDMNFDFWRNITLPISKNPKNSKFTATQMVINQFLRLQNDQN